MQLSLPNWLCQVNRWTKYTKDVWLGEIKGWNIKHKIIYYYANVNEWCFINRSRLRTPRYILLGAAKKTPQPAASNHQGSGNITVSKIMASYTDEVIQIYHSFRAIAVTAAPDRTGRKKPRKQHPDKYKEQFTWTFKLLISNLLDFGQHQPSPTD